MHRIKGIFMYSTINLHRSLKRRAIQSYLLRLTPFDERLCINTAKAYAFAHMRTEADEIKKDTTRRNKSFDSTQCSS